MSFGELIPQVFYDAIARFVAGLALIGTCMAVWWPNLEPLRNVVGWGLKNAAAITALVFLIGAYILALLIEGLSDLVAARSDDGRNGENVENDKNSKGDARQQDGKSEPHIKNWERSKKQFADIFGIECDKCERPSRAFAIDAVRLMDGDVGARIVKLRAERSLCRTLFVGWMLLGGVYTAHWAGIWFWRAEKMTDPTVAAIPLACLVVACVAIRCRQHALADRHWTALFNHWLLLVDPRIEVLEKRRSGAGSTKATVGDRGGSPS